MFFHKWIFLLGMMPLFCWGYDATPSCVLDLERNFFDEKIVGQALSLYNVPQVQWMNIAKDLRGATSDLHSRLREVTGKMRPDPTEPPFNKAVVGKVLEGMLHQIFVDVMAKYKFFEALTVTNSYQYIKNANSLKWKACLGK